MVILSICPSLSHTHVLTAKHIEPSLGQGSNTQVNTSTQKTLQVFCVKPVEKTQQKNAPNLIQFQFFSHAGND